MEHGDWPEYVPIGKRRALANKAMEQRRKKGRPVWPVDRRTKRGLADTFWGQAWCTHMESFSEFAGRLERGRTYARNGSVCHLGIKKGEVEACVQGSSLYTVTVSIKTLPKKRWTHIQNSCTGKLTTIMELLSGQLSDDIMTLVTDKKSGLFPGPSEITYKCSCPDSVSMCKHISAVFNAMGARLDRKPELLFQLRGADHRQLFTSQTTQLTQKKSSTSKTLDSDQLSDIFGFDLGDSLPVNTPNKKEPKKPKKAKQKATKAKKPVAKKAPPVVKELKEKELQCWTVAKLLDHETKTRQAVYRLSKEPWKALKNLHASLSRRVKSKSVSRRSKVWFYRLEGDEDPKEWLEFAKEQAS